MAFKRSWVRLPSAPPKFQGQSKYLLEVERHAHSLAFTVSPSCVRVFHAIRLYTYHLAVLSFEVPL